MKEAMKKITSLVAILSLVLGVQICAFGQEKGGLRNIEGVWQTVVTPRICATGAPVGPTFPGILMFENGGTMTGTSTAVTSAYGLWTRNGGPHKYSFSALSLKYDAAGNLVGTRRIDQDVALDPSGDGFISTGGFQDFDLAGNPTIAGCSSSVGTRFRQ